jgi:glycosyltransferase involved in cell wall biosynthesis
MVGQMRVAFVMEQTLGHITHAQNLGRFLSSQADVTTTWLPVPFEARGATRFTPLLRTNWSVRASWRARRALRAALTARRHDAVVFHTQVASLFSVDVMRRLPTVISLDATPINYDSVGEFYGHRAAGRGFPDRLKYRINRRAFHAAAGLVTWSQWARRSLVDDYGVDDARIRVIPPGVAACYFDVGERRAATRPSSAAECRPVRLLFVGGDFRRKGGPQLLACLEGSLAERCRLDVVTQANVEPRAGVRVHRGLGPNSPELLRLFAQADVFVLPSRADCLAMVLMEAAAAALPVVTTDVGALGEAVVDGESGFVVRAGDGAGLRRALEALVADRELRGRMGRTGLAVARRRFDARGNGRALLDFVIAATRTRPGSGTIA